MTRNLRLIGNDDLGQIVRARLEKIGKKVGGRRSKRRPTFIFLLMPWIDRETVFFEIKVVVKEGGGLIWKCKPIIVESYFIQKLRKDFFDSL